MEFYKKPPFSTTDLQIEKRVHEHKKERQGQVVKL